MSTNCSICGRPLTNPVSISRGLGPICAGRNYTGRIMSRFGSDIAGWSSREEWEKVNNPCYLCHFFSFPTKSQEETKGEIRIVKMYSFEKEFPLASIGGYCRKYKSIVDGNQIKNEIFCKGSGFRMRKNKVDLPDQGTLRFGDKSIKVNI